MFITAQSTVTWSAEKTCVNLTYVALACGVRFFLGFAVSHLGMYSMNILVYGDGYVLIFRAALLISLETFVSYHEVSTFRPQNGNV